MLLNCYLSQDDNDDNDFRCNPQLDADNIVQKNEDDFGQESADGFKEEDSFAR